MPEGLRSRHSRLLHGYSAQSGGCPIPGVARAPSAKLEAGVDIGPIPGSSVGISYNGGTVLRCPQIYVGFWGSDYYRDPGYITLSGQLTQFMKDLPNSDFMNVLTQYGAGFGAGLTGTFVQAHNLAITGTLFTNQDIENWIQILIDFNVIPDASPEGSLGANVMMIFLDDTISIEDPGFLGGDGGGLVLCEPNGDTAFGYHYYFNTNSGNPMYYAVVGALTDQCLQQSCPDDNSCNLHLNQTQLERITIVASHEMAEMMTDPEPFSGWVPEIGDVCAGTTDTLTVGANTWTVQRVYSVEDDLATGGATLCVGQKAALAPAQPGGPFAGVSGLASYRPGSLDRLLPLPQVVFHGEAKRLEMRDRDLIRYFNRLISPVRRSALPSHLPSMMRQLAATLESPVGSKRKKSSRGGEQSDA
jgi:hypothetical protein